MDRIFSLSLVLCLAVFASGCRTLPRGFSEHNSVYGVFGDCYAAGAKAMPLSNSFASLTAVDLDKAYPHVSLINCGVGGATIDSCTGSLPEFLDKIAKSKEGPMERAVLVIGMDSLQRMCGGFIHCDQPDAYSQGISYSFAYKAEMQTCITNILKMSPQCRLVLCTIPDPNNGGMGTCEAFRPAGMFKEFRKRIIELGEANQLPVADLYTLMMGHPEWFVYGDVHPNNAGHAQIAACVEQQFGITPEPTQTK